MATKQPNTQPTSGFDRIQGVLANIGTGLPNAVVRLFRMVSGRQAYLDRLQLTEDLLEQVKAAHGGGDYYAAVIDGKGKIVEQFYFTIDGTPKTQPAAVMEGAQSQQIAPVVETVLDRILNRLEKLETRPAPAAAVPPATDPLDMITKVAGVLATIQRAPIPNPLETLDLVLGIQDRLDGIRAGGHASSGKEDGWLVLARDLGKPALEVLAGAVGRGVPNGRRQIPAKPDAAPAQHAAPEHAAPAALPSTAQADAPPMADRVPENADPIVKLVASVPVPARRFLVQWAKDNADPIECSGRILNLLSDEQYQTLADQVDRPDFADVFANAVPNFRPYREWFGRLTVAIRAGMSDSDGEDGDGGDDVNPTNSTAAPAVAEGAA